MSTSEIYFFAEVVIKNEAIAKMYNFFKRLKLTETLFNNNCLNVFYESFTETPINALSSIQWTVSTILWKIFLF